MLTTRGALLQRQVARQGGVITRTVRSVAGRSHATNCVRRGRATRQGTLHMPLKPSLAIPSYKNTSIVRGFQPPRDHLSGPET
jgi:hypothetical protein